MHSLQTELVSYNEAVIKMFIIENIVFSVSVWKNNKQHWLNQIIQHITENSLSIETTSSSSLYLCMSISSPNSGGSSSRSVTVFYVTLCLWPNWSFPCALLLRFSGENTKEWKAKFLFLKCVRLHGTVGCDKSKGKIISNKWNI